MMLSRPVMLVLAVAVGLVGYTWYQERQEAPAEAPARPAARTPAKAPTASDASAASEPAAANASQAKSANLFPAQTWAPPPPPPPTPGPPTPTPVPVAPPLPFSVIGSWHERGNDQIVVEASGQQFVLCRRCDSLGRIQQGETLLGVYRVDDISRDAILFTYLPLNQQQSLPVGGTP
ncbi:hypothetical protein GCM10007860_09010 [Chitiniphilus shinanonensis]|uniref:Uncharacterized protein n=1 Tax=Chitiniphilus shinanonensis TaxID=553088 RepID=A0ABQ6BPK6_9NEIS|nr:hypothetical protein [Chitiniphilus shinanonensis]GLS03756.1 hypothetical protein GCM10007860_09010 [Chitiniphilus shinanonensis]